MPILHVEALGILVHNVLEPATFGVPIVIGSNYSHFAEAIALVNMEACTP
jgi:3-deoxy-D-manno-octulosonic-acid transferase